MSQRWICISTQANDRITRQKKIWGVSKHYQKIIGKVKKKDTLVMYVKKEIVDNKIFPSAFTSIYEVESEVFLDSNTLFETPPAMGNEKFPFRIKVKPINIFKKPLQLKPLIPKLSFIKNKEMWTGSVRKAMRLISEEDYQIIVKTAEVEKQ